jgi:hypothetical protein
VKVGTACSVGTSHKPCVWLVKKEDMLTYDDDKHGHLPTKDWPPRNVSHKKIYYQMTLSINKGPFGKGVCKDLLPECVVSCCRKSLTPPTFMGFKEN